MKIFSHMKAAVPKNVWAMGITSFFNDMSSEMIYPILPIFLTRTLGAPVEIVGFIEGVAAITSHGLRIISGWLSDKIGRRKPIVLIGYSLSSFAKILFGYAHVWTTVLLARFCDRFGKGVRTGAKEALVTESALGDHRGIAFGVNEALDTGGAVLGPLLAVLFLFLWQLDFRTIFFLALIPALLGLIIFAFFVTDVPADESVGKEPVDFSLRGIGSPYRQFLLVSAIFALGNSAEVFMILRAQSLGMSVIQTILAYTLGNLTYALCAMPAGALIDRVSPKRVLLSGFMLFALVYIGFGFATHKSFIWLLYAGYGIFMALTSGVGKAYVASLVPFRRAGTAFGVYNAVQGVCQMIASIIAGFLWQRIGMPAPFIFGGSMAIIACIFFMALEKNNI